MRKILVTIAILACTVVACDPNAVAPEHDVVVISVMGTNDVHGELIPQPDRGGLLTFSGYVAALRAARAQDGAVLLVDAGDMWQGTLESNLSEGAPVVEVYNALGYAAAAIGNHEFDFGPVGPKAIPQSDADDPQGALRLRATEANFPLLAANLIDLSTGKPVDWKNVRPSTMVTRSGVDIGIIGVITERTAATTIIANLEGLEVAPLADAIIREALTLREAGASLIVVVAHAGSRCEEFDDPDDLSSCIRTGEIFNVANDIPVGLVDHIVAGHVHRGIAHIVNGIAVTSSYSKTVAFSRVDFTIDRDSGAIINRRIYPPRSNCAKVPDEHGRCTSDGDLTSEQANYEGYPVVPIESVAVIAERAREHAAQRQAQEVGVFLETAITLEGRHESALGNLMTDAVRESTDADIALHNVVGGIRADLPAGELTYGRVFRMFPFDNRVAVLDMSGMDLRRIIHLQARKRGRRAGFSGMRVFVVCSAGEISVRMQALDGRDIQDSDTLRVASNDFLLLGGDGIFTPVMPEQGFDIPYGTPLVRDAMVSWFKERGGSMRADEFLQPDHLRWNLPDPVSSDCSVSGS